MPMLEEVFKQFPNIPINLDIKGDDVELMQLVKMEDSSIMQYDL